jgi:hypothetical protein
MLRNILVGLPVMLMCLTLQATFVTICLRRYQRFRASQSERPTRFADMVLLSIVMLLMLLANVLQIAVWGGLFVALGEFSDYPTALYYSAVNFVTLGYGDIIMTERWRLLGPLEAVNGVLMFGVSTAVITSAVLEVIKTQQARQDRR